jgi:7-cyano-7-deazaguanine synthase
MKARAVVLSSGGLDSTTCLGIAEAAGFEVWPFSVSYGQRHRREVEAAEAVARHYRATERHRVVTLPDDLLASPDSALTGATPMPHATYADLMAAEGPSPTVVPFRNANLIALATARAIQVGAEAVYFGAHAEDAHHWAYPDCTPEFIGAMAAAVFIGSYRAVRLVTPLEWLTKAEVCAEGLRLGAPYHLTLSCYEGTVPACGRCPTCVERRHAFAANGASDPIPYSNAA